jgi:uncharacterized membrane protein
LILFPLRSNFSESIFIYSGIFIPIETLPFANIIVGLLIFVVGFILHWVTQLISAISWEYAKKVGLQEKTMPEEFKVYEQAIARADALIGWIYGIVAVGLILDISWAFNLAWIPGVILVYHGLSAWFWMGNQKKSGHQLSSNKFRVTWFLLNFITGIIVILIAL